FGDDAPVVLAIEPLPDLLRRRGERQLHGVPTQRFERALPLPLQLLAGAGEQLLLLRTRALQHFLADPLRRLTPLRGDLLGLLPRLGELALVLLHLAFGLGPVPRGGGEDVLDATLTRVQCAEDRLPRELGQHRQKRQEDDDGPDHEARVDAEQASASPGVFLDDQEKVHGVLSVARAARPLAPGRDRPAPGAGWPAVTAA